MPAMKNDPKEAARLSASEKYYAEQLADYPDEADLIETSDGVLGADGNVISNTQRFKVIGDKVEGFFLGLDYQVAQSKDGERAFCMAGFRAANGQEMKCFLPVAAEAFIFGYEFPVNEFLRITFIGENPIPGRNAMKMFRYQYDGKLQLKPSKKYMSVAEMRTLYAPKSQIKKSVALATAQ